MADDQIEKQRLSRMQCNERYGLPHNCNSPRGGLISPSSEPKKTPSRNHNSVPDAATTAGGAVVGAACGPRPLPRPLPFPRPLPLCGSYASKKVLVVGNCSWDYRL